MSSFKMRSCTWYFWIFFRLLYFFSIFFSKIDFRFSHDFLLANRQPCWCVRLQGGGLQPYAPDWRAEKKIFFWKKSTSRRVWPDFQPKVKKKNCPRRFPLGRISFGPVDLANFGGRCAQNRAKSRNLAKKSDLKFFFGLYILILTHFMPVFKKNYTGPLRGRLSTLAGLSDFRT